MRFLYALTFYVLLAGTTLAGLALAPIAAVTGRPWIDVSYLAFIAHWWPIPVWLLLMILLLRRRGLLRPSSAPVLSWESWLYGLARVPYVGWGICAAFWGAIRPRRVTFKITPKRAAGVDSLPARAVAPYAAISVVSSAAALFGERLTSAAGYVFLCLLAAAVYGLVVTAIPVLHAREAAARTGLSRRAALRQTARRPAVLAGITVAIAIVAVASFPMYAAPLLSRTF